MTVKSFHPLALLCVLSLVSSPAHANEDLQKQAHDLEQEIRCPVCLGQSIAESETSEAIALKTFVLSRLQQGDAPSVILEKLRTLYGDAILFRPPFSSHTLFLWLAPFGLFLIICLGGAMRLFMKRHRTHA